MIKRTRNLKDSHCHYHNFFFYISQKEFDYNKQSLIYSIKVSLKKGLISWKRKGKIKTFMGLESGGMTKYHAIIDQF